MDKTEEEDSRRQNEGGEKNKVWGFLSSLSSLCCGVEKQWLF